MAQTLITLVLSWMAPLWFGRALVRRLLGPGLHWLPLGAVLGLGASGSLLFLWAFAFGLGRASIVAMDALLVLLALALSRRRGASPPPGAAPSRGAAVPRAVALLLLGALVTTHVAFGIAEPNGTGDAASIWNMRASFLVNAWGRWDRILDPQSLAHVGYPLLLPLLVARGWSWCGGMTALVPQSLALVYTACTVGILHAAVLERRGRPLAALGSALLFGTPFFLGWSAAQAADVPLCCYVLATLVLLERGKDTGTVTLAGLAAGCAAWTKNEGLVLAALALPLLALRAGRGRALVGLVAGAAVPLLALFVFKTWLAPANEYLETLKGGSTLARVADPSRWAQTASAFFTRLVSLSGSLPGFGIGTAAVLFFLLVSGRDPRARVPVRSAAVVVALFALYFAIFVALSPYDLAWQLGTSANRLLLHFYPATIFVVCSVVRDPFGAPGGAEARPG